jgi:hypothetical protein
MGGAHFQGTSHAFIALQRTPVLAVPALLIDRLNLYVVMMARWCAARGPLCSPGRRFRINFRFSNFLSTRKASPGAWQIVMRCCGLAPAVEPRRPRTLCAGLMRPCAVASSTTCSKRSSARQGWPPARRLWGYGCRGVDLQVFCLVSAWRNTTPCLRHAVALMAITGCATHGAGHAWHVVVHPQCWQFCSVSRGVSIALGLIDQSRHH